MSPQIPNSKSSCSNICLVLLPSTIDSCTPDDQKDQAVRTADSIRSHLDITTFSCVRFTAIPMAGWCGAS